MKGRVVVCGNVVLDIVVRPVQEPLGWGATTVVESIEQHLGGNGGSTGYTLAKLGVPVTLMSLAGQDAAAEQVLERLRGVGVECAVTQGPLATSVSVSLVEPGGRRALLYQLGASAGDFPKPVRFGKDAAHFHLAAVYRMRDLRCSGPSFLRVAKEAGLSTSVDTQWDHLGEWLPVLEPALPWTDLLFVNEDEAAELTGIREPAAAALALRDLGAREVVVKLGERGCFASTAQGDFYSDALKVNAVDTTGAGDCFVGAYLAALHGGEPHREAAAFANRIASLAVQALGATAGLDAL
ncbi:MAG: carbohydrate kinase family protein [Acidobacteriota bacterium]|nr:carbohydrate kinase family protein [Acidobacteriota bacterium]